MSCETPVQAVLAAPDSPRPPVQPIIRFIQYDPGIESLYSQCWPAEKSLSALRSDLMDSKHVMQRQGTRPDIHSSFPSIADRNVPQCHRTAAPLYILFYFYTQTSDIYLLSGPSLLPVSLFLIWQINDSNDSIHLIHITDVI